MGDPNNENLEKTILEIRENENILNIFLLKGKKKRIGARAMDPWVGCFLSSEFPMLDPLHHIYFPEHHAQEYVTKFSGSNNT